MMITRRTATTMLSAATLGLGSVVLLAPAASASDYCPANHVCMWEDDNFTGDRWVDQELGAIGSAYDIDWYDGDNEISSIENGGTVTTGKHIRVYGNDDLSGDSVCLAPNVLIGDLDIYGFDNDAESFVIVASC